MLQRRILPLNLGHVTVRKRAKKRSSVFAIRDYKPRLSLSRASRVPAHIRSRSPLLAERVACLASQSCRVVVLGEQCWLTNLSFPL